MDLIGPMPVEPRSRTKYVLTFIDDYSGYVLVAFIRNKDATAQYFQSMARWLRPSPVIRSPLYVQTVGGNSWAKSFKRSFRPEASLIRLQFPIHSNRTVMERFNRTLLEKAEAI